MPVRSGPCALPHGMGVGMGVAESRAASRGITNTVTSAVLSALQNDQPRWGPVAAARVSLSVCVKGLSQ